MALLTRLLWVSMTPFGLPGVPGQDAHGGDEPLDPVLGQDADALTGLDACLDQGGSARQGRGAVILPGQVVVDPPLLEAQGGTLPLAFRLPALNFDEVAIGH